MMFTGMAQLSVLIFALLPAHMAAMDGQIDTTVLLQARKAKLNEVECPGDPPCSDHGDCKPKAEGSSEGACHCNFGWKGDDCSESQCDSKKCSEHGICALGECDCYPGWEGDDCSEAQSPCVPQCSEHAICIAGECACGLGGRQLFRVAMWLQEVL